MKKLTYAQKKIACAPGVRQSMIKGERQTGKTTIGIARMLYLLESTGEKLLFVTPQKESYEVARQRLETVKNRENMNLFESESYLSQGEIYELSDFLSQLAKDYLKEQHYFYIEEIPEALLEVSINKVKKIYPRLKCLKEKHLLQEEIKWIAVKGYIAPEDYLEADRVGCQMKLPKRGKSREAIWLLKNYVEEALENQGQMTIYQRDLKLLQMLKDKKVGTYAHLIIDDAHLLTQVQIELLGLLRKDRAGEVLFLVDSKPEPSRMLGLTRGKSYKQLGYDMTGKVRRLGARKQSRKKKVKHLEALEPTPLERFIQNPEAFTLESKSSVIENEEDLKSNDVKKKKTSNLPWYVQTYKYINKLTGLETIFMQDTSAGETYIDETREEEVQSLPIYSDIAAGMPIEVVEETCGTFEIPEELLGYKKNTYMLHVQGDSMIGAGIEDGDYVVIQAGSVSNHEIAAVYYNGAITLKRIVQEEEHILLVSENPKYRPIKIEDGEFRAMGKLIGVLKSM